MADQDNTTVQANRNGARGRTRRQLLAGGTVTMAAAVTAEVLARPAPAQAANGGNVILGQGNLATATTSIENSTDSSAQSALHAAGAGSTTAISGMSERGIGLAGVSNSGVGVAGATEALGPALSGRAGVQGHADGGTGGYFVADGGKGVYGQSGGSASPLVPVKHGVHGVTDSATGFGVVGENLAGGAAVAGIGGDFGVVGSSNAGCGVEGISGGDSGVRGLNSGSGNGVHGDAFSGTGVLATGKTALSVQGPAVFSRSGILTARAGHSSVTKTGVPLTSASLVLATLQQDHEGVWIRSAVPDRAGSSFTVHLSKAAPANIKVAWFVVN